MALVLESEPIIGGNHVIHSSDFPCAIEVNVGDENSSTSSNKRNCGYIPKNSRSEVKAVDKMDPCGPYQIQANVCLLVEKWGQVFPIPPDQFLLKLVKSRGYNNSYLPFSETSSSKRNPTPKQIQDFDNDLVRAVRTSDINKLKSQHLIGKSMSACNKYSESIVHMACRRSDFQTTEFVLKNGGDLSIVDDYGRTALHDACWRTEPRFDIVTLILDQNLDILFYLDVRGCPPLKYVQEEHWSHWCAYLFHQKEKYWSLSADAARDSDGCGKSSKRAKTDVQM